MSAEIITKKFGGRIIGASYGNNRSPLTIEETKKFSPSPLLGEPDKSCYRFATHFLAKTAAQKTCRIIQNHPV